MNELENRVAKLEGILGRGNFNSSTVQQKDATFNGHFKIGNRTALPTTCSVGELAMLNGSLYECHAANTWLAIGAIGYGGTVPAAGTGSTLPTGWSASLNGATHTYTVTHNLNTTAYTVVAVARGSNAVTSFIPFTTFNANTFTVFFDSSLGAAGNTDWTFVLTLIT